MDTNYGAMHAAHKCSHNSTQKNPFYSCYYVNRCGNHNG